MNNNLSRIMGEKRLKISTISRETGISRSTLTKMYYNRSSKIMFSTIEKLCDYLDVDFGDLISM